MILGKGVSYEKIITSTFDILEPPCVDRTGESVIKSEAGAYYLKLFARRGGPEDWLPIMLIPQDGLRVDSPLDRYTSARMRSPVYSNLFTSLHPDIECLT